MIFANLSFLCYNIEYLNLQNFDIRRYVRLVTSWRVWNAVWHKQYYHTKHISLHLITFHKLHWNIKSKSHFESKVVFAFFVNIHEFAWPIFGVNLLTKTLFGNIDLFSRKFLGGNGCKKVHEELHFYFSISFYQ